MRTREGCNHSVLDQALRKRTFRFFLRRLYAAPFISTIVLMLAGNKHICALGSVSSADRRRGGAGGARQRSENLDAIQAYDLLFKMQFLFLQGFQVQSIRRRAALRHFDLAGQNLMFFAKYLNV